MRKIFKKNEQIRSFNVVGGKVITSITIDNRTVVNPLLADFLSAGWQEHTPPTPLQYVPTYSELVEQYIREHGYPTYGAEIAVQNNYVEDPVQYLSAWREYMSVRHDAKEWADGQPHREEE